MNNPRNIFSKEDIIFLEQNDINVPNKDLEDEEWLEFEMEISKKITTWWCKKNNRYIGWQH